MTIKMFRNVVIIQMNGAPMAIKVNLTRMTRAKLHKLILESVHPLEKVCSTSDNIYKHRKLGQISAMKHENMYRYIKCVHMKHG